MSMNKIKTLDELSIILDFEKQKGKKIVHCHGCFDYLHFGHLKHFESAKKQGDILAVTVTPDEFIEKGSGSPFYSQDLRLEFIASLEPVDWVALNKWSTAVETILALKPNVYAKGKEVLDNRNVDELRKGVKKISNLEAELEALRSIGGELYLTDETTFSASRIINQITSAIPEESKFYLNDFRKKYTSENIIQILESLNKLRVLVIGDSILDQYTYCQLMERSGKEPLISYKFLKSDIHLGGVFAVVSHVANFTQNPSLITCIGRDTYEFIESNLNHKIERNIFIQRDAKTITKQRYLDDYRKLKLFQVYNSDELKLSEANEEKVLRFLQQNLQGFDMIIVSDFGHGMISEPIKNYLNNCNKPLAVNCQLNAGNLGYNFITKYSRADFVSLSERELRLPFQEKKGNIEIPILKLRDSLNTEKIIVTLGRSGCMYYQKGNFYHSPSFTKEPLDTIGSGDALFSLSSLLAYTNVEPEIIPFLGNCIGGLATRIMGNEKTVGMSDLKKFVTYIMK